MIKQNLKFLKGVLSLGGKKWQPRTQALFKREKYGFYQGLYTDQLQIEQARKGIWGVRDGRGKCLAENETISVNLDRYL